MRPHYIDIIVLYGNYVVPSIVLNMCYKFDLPEFILVWVVVVWCCFCCQAVVILAVAVPVVIASTSTSTIPMLWRQ